jgi:hypothetical protein
MLLTVLYLIVLGIMRGVLRAFRRLPARRPRGMCVGCRFVHMQYGATAATRCSALSVAWCARYRLMCCTARTTSIAMPGCARLGSGSRQELALRKLRRIRWLANKKKWRTGEVPVSPSFCTSTCSNLRLVVSDCRRHDRRRLCSSGSRCPKVADCSVAVEVGAAPVSRLRWRNWHVHC